MKKLLGILSSIAMVGTAGATVVACKDTKKEENSQEALSKKIDEVEKIEEEIVANSSEKWSGIAPSTKVALDAAINTAKSLADDKEASDATKKAAIEDLDKAIEKFKSSLPENIVSEAINLQNKDIEEKFSKDWTYSSFWNMDNEKDDDNQERIMDMFYGSVRKIAEESGYEEEELDVLHSTVLNWSQESVSLVYLDVNEKGNQEVTKTFTSNDKDSILEDLFLDEVKANHNDELTDGELPDGFWENPKHAKLSLGIIFDKGSEDKELPDGTRDFWTFTFKTA